MAASSSKRIAFLCSGGGGNLRFTQEAIDRGWIPQAQICAVLTDRACVANDFAASRGIPQRVLDFKKSGQEKVLGALEAAAPDLVITTVHRILAPEVVGRFRGKLLNLHYSLLPAFGGSIGTRPVEAAIRFGARFAGVTAHEVDETVDGGKPVVQAVFPLHPGESADDVMNLVFRCGCLALTAAINVNLHGAASFPGQSLAVLERACWFSAALGPAESGVSDEHFWAAVAGTAPVRPASS